MDAIAKKLKRSRWIVTNLVRRIQDKNPRCTCLILRIWSAKICHLPRYFRIPQLDMHRVIFCKKNKRLRASQRCTKLQRHSLILLIAFLRKNSDGIALKALEKYHGCNKTNKST
ncbi:hypothetical protein EV2_007177 [Malus domestica]